MTGVRLGESAMRDAKILKSSCAAGGECGLPTPDASTYAPIVNWSLCQVIDWLQGLVSRDVTARMKDVFAITRELLSIYDVRVDRNVFPGFEPIVDKVYPRGWSEADEATLPPEGMFGETP
jgi:hypothetical protein